MEKREPAKILATVFHRERMRFILNEAGVRNLTAFHCIYPKFDNILMVKALLAYLNSDLCKQIQTIKRREYGGGLHKFEPKDLENIPTLDVTKLSISDLESLASAFDELCITFRKGADETPVRRKIDSILRYIILKSAET
jgi:adenine-specific DNA-methyltransferase